MPGVPDPPPPWRGPGAGPDDADGAVDAEPPPGGAGAATAPAPTAVRRRTRVAATVLPAWQDRDLSIILGARLSMSAARAIAGVVTAIYLAAEGFSAFEIGLLFVGVTVTSALMSSAIGMLSDRVGRKPFLVAVPLLAAGAAAVYAVERAPVALFVCAAIGTFGRGAGAGGGSIGPYQPAESAYVAERVPGTARASAFGRLSFTSALGALIGGLLAGLAHGHPQSALAATALYRPAFVAAAVLAAVAGFAALWLHDPHGLHDAQDARDRDERAGLAGHPATRRRRTRLHWPRRSWPALWRLWVTNGVNGTAIGLFGPFLSYWLNRRYGVGAGEIGVLFAIVNLASLAPTLAAASIGRRLGTVRAIVTVRALSGLLLVPMAFSPTFAIAGAVLIARMLAQRVGLPLRQSFTQDLAHPEERASVAALALLPSQAMMAGSQPVAGLLFEVDLALPLVLGGVFQCLNAILYAVLFAWAPPRSHDAEALAGGAAPEPADTG